MEGPSTVTSPKVAEDEKRNLLNEDRSNAKTSPALPSAALLSPDFKGRRTSVAPGAQFGIYWWSPATMILAFLLGLGSALALHGYYSSLNGKTVGNTDQQQTALRVGTTFALITQVSLDGSIRFAFVQNLWWALKTSIISIYGVDAGFAATNSLLSFTNVEMLSKLKLASFLAFIAWCIPISSLITPATLNVDSVLQQNSQMMNVSVLDISQASGDIAHSVSRTNTLQKYLGPRSILIRSAVATSTTGQILPWAPPTTNATYEQTFFGPYVQCLDANQTVINHIDAANKRRKAAIDASIKELANDYFSYVPALSNLNDTSPNTPIQVANLSDVNAALYASNQLWLTFPRYNASDLDNLNVSQVANPHYLACELHNASYHVNFTWVNGIQSLDILNLDVLDVTPYPVTPSYSASDEDTMAYTALMWALSDQLTGSMGFYQDVSTNGSTNNEIIANRTYTEINTDIAQTSLLGTSDLNSYFIKNHALTNTDANRPFSTGRLADMALARNRTLDVLIPELSINITLSLISNPSLTPLQPTNVTTTTPTNVYVYHSQNVFISYSFAIFFTLLANILGLYAYFANGVSHDTSFSSIVCTTRDIHLSKLNAHERLGALPLEKKVGRTKVKFDVGKMAEGLRGVGPWGFGLA